jgi:hypothetical protein
MATYWPPNEVLSSKTSLDDLEATLEIASSDHPEYPYRDWLGRFLVIRSAGYIEFAVSAIAREHVRRKSGGSVEAFALSWLDKSRNPSRKNLAEFLARFGQEIRIAFDTFMDDDDERLDRELAFMIDRRNRLAHGENESVNVAKAILLKDVAVEIVDWIAEALNPDA